LRWRPILSPHKLWSLSSKEAHFYVVTLHSIPSSGFSCCLALFVLALVPLRSALSCSAALRWQEVSQPVTAGNASLWFHLRRLSAAFRKRSRTWPKEPLVLGTLTSGRGAPPRHVFCRETQISWAKLTHASSERPGYVALPISGL
jgi:hypothetical protein